MKDKVEAIIKQGIYTPQDSVLVYMYAYGAIPSKYDTLNIDVLWNDYEDFNSKVSKCIIDKNKFDIEAEKYHKKGIKEEDRKANYSILEMYNEQLKTKRK